MYSFHIKDNGPDLDITVTRAMLALSAIATLVYRSDGYFFINALCALALVLGAVFIKLLLKKFKLNKLVLLAASAIILFIATHSIAFAVVLLMYGYLIKFLNQKPLLQVGENGIMIKKLFTSPAYRWGEFTNVVLKDNLLTLDFKNNKLIQVDIDENEAVVEPTAFNDFCKRFIEI